VMNLTFPLLTQVKHGKHPGIVSQELKDVTVSVPIPARYQMNPPLPVSSDVSTNRPLMMSTSFHLNRDSAICRLNTFWKKTHPSLFDYGLLRNDMSADAPNEKWPSINYLYLFIYILAIKKKVLLDVVEASTVFVQSFKARLWELNDRALRQRADKLMATLRNHGEAFHDRYYYLAAFTK